MDNNEFCKLPVTVTIVLKNTQGVYFDKYYMTYKGERKEVMNRTVKFDAETLLDAVNAINIDECVEVNIRYSNADFYGK